MIKKLLLKFGRSKEDEALSFNPGSITVFVGPNNSGKSLALREIENYSKSGPQANRIRARTSPQVFFPKLYFTLCYKA